MELREYLRVLRRSWASIIVLVVLGALAGGGTAFLQSPRYAATAKAFVSASSASSLSDLSAGVSFTQQAVGSYADIATTAYVLQPVITRLGLHTTAGALAREVAVTAAPDEAVLQITVTDASAATAAHVANAIAAQLATAVVRLTPDSGSSTGVAPVKLTPVDPAVTPTTSIAVKPAALVAGGAAAGLFLAIVISVLRESLDTRIRTSDDLLRVTEKPLLGTTVRSAQRGHRALVLDTAARGPEAEAYRTIRTSLRFVQMPDKARSIVVTSSIDGEGKSTTAANLAIAMADLGWRVLLVDADLRRPRVAEIFGVDGAVGLTDVLIGASSLKSALQSFGRTTLDLLPAGTIPPNPNEQLQSRAMHDLIGQLHTEYDLVVYDSPPVLAVSDATLLSARVGATIVVCASGRARRPQLEVALAALDRAGAQVAGVVLSMVPRRGPDANGYGYGYGPAAEHHGAVVAPQGSSRIQQERGAW